MNKTIDFLSNKKNKQRLLRLLKKNGEYLGFRKTEGFIYLLNIGEVDGNAVFIEVALNNGDLTILGTHVGEEVNEFIHIAN
ncbi:hypothetical protein [Alkalihalobacillus sp. BA299]|uniref:hypothetical protein n=1 Tax=Alkalihalobacillus sp. BA299 TaxID=2815938 RepID=UPI001ADB69DC|nr:hypothetical protein [Alkalihalobacillus sp. BA299]